MSRKAPAAPAAAAHETPPALAALEARGQQRLADAQAELAAAERLGLLP